MPWPTPRTLHRQPGRVLAATNRDLKAEVDAGRFRQDLFYRLNVFPIEVPPLRKRKEDIPLLANLFLERAASRFKRPCKALSQSQLLALQAYDWPGNVRELLNVIERAIITSRAGVVRLDLPAAQSGKRHQSDPATSTVVTEAEMKRRDRENLLAALEQTGWRVHGPDDAAEILGMRPTTLASRIKRMGLSRSS